MRSLFESMKECGKRETRDVDAFVEVASAERTNADKFGRRERDIMLERGNGKTPETGRIGWNRR